MTHWRSILARSPLPMLALAASYGVYSYARLYVPWPVALVQAAAFEMTYVGLAISREMDGDERRRARAISLGAVACSIAYNALAGLFHRRPDLLVGLPLVGELAFAALHGLPLAWVAYLVADLLLHSASQSRAPRYALARSVPAPEPMPAPEMPLMPADAGIRASWQCPTCGHDLPSQSAYGAAKRWRHCRHCK